MVREGLAWAMDSRAALVTWRPAQGEGLQPGRWEGRGQRGLLRRRTCFRKRDAERRGARGCFRKRDAERRRARGRGVTEALVRSRFPGAPGQPGGRG